MIRRIKALQLITTVEIISACWVYPHLFKLLVPTLDGFLSNNNLINHQEPSVTSLQNIEERLEQIGEQG